jgi:tetratricopeptide (TPR) repeat protein
MWRFATICKGALPLLAFLLANCRQTTDQYQSLVEGSISYPFADQTQPIGKDSPGDRFVIRSVKGGAEYIVEIPHGAADYDISIPMTALPNDDGQIKVQNPQLTDRELLSTMPGPSQDQERDRSMLEEAMGVGAAEGPEQGPSYSLGLARIMDLYKKRNYEYALIEVNQLLAYYPNAARLYKMKGTILLKTGDLLLAEKAWLRAAELDPADRAIQRGIERLRKRLELQQKSLPQKPQSQSKKSRKSFARSSRAR